MSTFLMEDIVFEGWIEKKSKHSDSYKKRGGVLSKDTFYVFKKPKKYNNALDTIPITKISSIILPSDQDKLFILIDNDNNEYHFKSNDKQKWAHLMKQKCDDIIITTDDNNNNNNNNNIDDEIQENHEIIDIENDLSIVPFDIGLLNYNPNYAQNTNTKTPTMTDAELEISNTGNYDFQIIEEVDFYIIDTINGYLRELKQESIISTKKTIIPQIIPDLVTVFYFIRKFDTRRLRPDCDF